MNWLEDIPTGVTLAILALGLLGFVLMTAAFVMVGQRGGWQHALQPNEQGNRWPLPRVLLLVGASMGALFPLLLLLLSYLLQPPVLREVRQFEGHSSVVSRVAISADGQMHPVRP